MASLAVFGLYLWIGENQPKLAMLFLLSVFIGLAATLVVAADRLRYLLRPIGVVNRAIQRVRSGQLDTRVENVSSGEMGELEAGFNAMAQELVSSQEELQEKIDQATREAQESMEVIEIRNAELDLARRRAIEASRTKSEFLANMSHEIRTPMNGVIGFTQLLAKTDMNDQQRYFLQTIQRSASSLLRIVDDILDFSQLESGKLVLNHEPFSLRECVESAVTLWAPQAHAKQLELVWMVYSDVRDYLVGDETRILQILNNIIGNAIKFTEQGEIVMRVMLEEEAEHFLRITFSISDTGIGIPQEEQQRLFDAFDQGSAGGDRLLAGTGLGLSICHSLAEAMHGEIRVDSTPEEGSEFRVTLQLEQDPDAPPAAPMVPLNHKGMLIDTHELSRIALGHALKDMGLAVEEHAVFPTLMSFDPASFSLVVLGCAADEDQIRNAQAFVTELVQQHKLPVIVLVSSSEEELITQFTKAGASFCLSKPPQLHQLREKLHGCLTAGTPSKASNNDLQVPTESVEFVQDNVKPLIGKTCVAADDHQVNLQLITYLLRDMGAEVLQANDGYEAVALTNEHNVDMVFIDVHMPRMNGLEAAKKIRTLDAGHSLPIVALTADAAERNQREISRAGIDRYIIKPVAEENLRQIINELLEGTQAPTTPLVITDTPQPNGSDRPVRDPGQALRIAGGSESIAAKLFEELCNELPSALAQIQACFMDKDWPELWQLSHRLHGASAVCGVPSLYHALGELQRAVWLEDQPTVTLLLDRVADEIAQVLASTE